MTITVALMVIWIGVGEQMIGARVGPSRPKVGMRSLKIRQRFNAGAGRCRGFLSIRRVAGLSRDDDDARLTARRALPAQRNHQHDNRARDAKDQQQHQTDRPRWQIQRAAIAVVAFTLAALIALRRLLHVSAGGRRRALEASASVAVVWVVSAEQAATPAD